MPRTIGPAQRSVLDALTASDQMALTTAELVEACGLTERRIRQITDALAQRGLLVITRTHLGWKGVGKFGSLARYSAADERNGLSPSLSLKKGDPWPIAPEWWKTCARDVDFIRQGTPTSGRLHWLPAQRAEWERRDAETTAAIRRAFGMTS